jgi:hypothetical protein
MATREAVIERGAYNFDMDLQTNYEVEMEFKALIESRKDVYKVTKNDNYKYDLKVEKTDGKTYTLELKNDMLSAQTGNIGVEFESRGKPSGIARSEADWWVYKLTDGYWMISASKLKQLIKDEKFWSVKAGGDADSNTKLYLFKASTLKAEMKRYGS